MRKLVLVAIAFIALSFTACGNKVTDNTEKSDSVTVDSITQVDSIALDSITE